MQPRHQNLVRLRTHAATAAVIAATLGSLIGCVTLRRGNVTVTRIAPVDSAARSLGLLSQRPYVADLVAALGEYGFRVRPLVRAGQAQVAATSGGAGIALFENERYGLQIGQRLDKSCAFTSSSIYDFSVSVVDIWSCPDLVER